MSNPLDATNKKILTILQTNGRISATEIAKRINLSRTAVQDRIARLEKSGVIEGYTAVVNPHANTSVNALIFATFAQHPCDTTINWLLTLEGVTKVTSLSGELDAVIFVSLNNLQALSTFNDLLKNNSRIKTSKSQVVLSSFNR